MTKKLLIFVAIMAALWYAVAFASYSQTYDDYLECRKNPENVCSPGWVETPYTQAPTATGTPVPYYPDEHNGDDALTLPSTGTGDGDGNDWWWVAVVAVMSAAVILFPRRRKKE